MWKPLILVALAVALGACGRDDPTGRPDRTALGFAGSVLPTQAAVAFRMDGSADGSDRPGQIRSGSDKDSTTWGRVKLLYRYTPVPPPSDTTCPHGPPQ
jgi:hypothetical protein